MGNNLINHLPCLFMIAWYQTLHDHCGRRGNGDDGDDGGRGRG